MNDGLKQRIVGALVLVVIAVIFLPMVFNFDAERIIDRTSQIPPRPQIEPVTVAEPDRPADIDYPAELDKAYQFDQSRTEVEAEIAAAKQQPGSSDAEMARDEQPKVQNEPEPPKLSEQNLPEGWVIQVGSFKEQEKAQQLVEKLITDGYKAYQREARRQGYFRVYVGPNIDKGTAQKHQQDIDRKYRVKSLLLKFES
ncbi:SPOR domain-containing protein [Porticoccaceae bacterium LTM1]|nr:SPOR domain-containing protein [Porticoccaceae bacterium LTM1]